MATSNADRKTKWDADNLVGATDNIIERGLVNTPVKIIQEVITTLANANQVYKLLSPPKYATIIEVKARGVALGAGTAILVGDANDDNRYIASSATTSAFSLGMTGALASASFYQTGQASGDNELQAQITGTPTADLKVYIEIWYTS